MDSESELLALPPAPNVLNLVYRDVGCMKFMKFVTSTSPCVIYDFQNTFITEDNEEVNDKDDDNDDVDDDDENGEEDEEDDDEDNDNVKDTDTTTTTTTTTSTQNNQLDKQ
eukprot:TRINITY_DN1924_c0_g1_i1.p2 TRINITY_DN1924_c0_g1~~TRINITY_DN1924_c0_g1_i1.p2  ORF type:complete len:111 (+),score=43.65 TRINITY_DN1924_c0_g1_i1:771-1103(+)